MNFKQIRKAAENDCRFLLDPDYVRIYIGSLADNPTVTVLSRSLQEEISNQGFKAYVISTGSSGYYDLEPSVIIEKPEQFSLLCTRVTGEKVSQILNDCLVKGYPEITYIMCNLSNNKISGIPDALDIPLINLQNRIALRNCGFIDPNNINHYIVRGNGYQGLARCLQMKPAAVIEELKKAGLRGRGGAGFSAAEKWTVCKDTTGDDKFVICNAIDADPHAFTARLLLEGDPHSVLEGILIAAYAIGAKHCFICVNDDYYGALERLNKALQQMRTYNLVGNSILDSDFTCDLEIKTVTHSLVSGEETALLSFLMGKQLMPYLRLHYPATSGYFNKPTLVNNVETFSNVSAIFQKGSDLYTNVGTEKSKGTKIVTLAGKKVNRYTVEVPFGSTIRSMLTGIGGISGDTKLKAVQFGGPTGVFFKDDSLDISIDFESIRDVHSIIGSGTIEVFDGDTCAVEMAMNAISYLQTQSCGKCVFCREGTYQLSEILRDIETKGGKSTDIDLLTEIGEAMKIGSICGLGKTASNPVLSNLNIFRNDYESHMKERGCPQKCKKQ